MTVAAWVPGKFYAPGDLTIPTSTLMPEQSGLPNGNFESGDVEWTKQTGFTIVNGETAFQGTWSAKKSDGNPSSIINDVRAPVTPGQSIRASCVIKLGSDSSPSSGLIILRWYASGGALLSTTGGSLVNSGTGWKTSTVTGAAPSGAATVSVEVSVNKSASQPPNYVDNVSWSYTDNVAVSPKLVYKAVQPDIGKSGLIEPTWPATLGQTVVDNEVTWEAIGDTRIVWTGTPLFLSGEYEPIWPTAPGDVVADNSIGWQCVVRNITDENCPNTRVVLIASSKIFAIDDDIIAYSATVNPLDWSTENDAGYLPTGLQQYGSNPMAAMGLYRGNLVAWNAQGAQIWQVDEDPARMALLDTLPIGCTFPKSVAPIADDLFFATQLGIRSFGLAAGSTNLATGDVGVPIDPLVESALRSSPSDAKGTYLPSKGQYWVWFQGMYIVGDAPNTYVGASYNHQYEAVGGVAPITYAVTAGELPAGLSMSSGGLITGTPTTEETQAFTVTATDANGLTATVSDSIAVLVTNVFWLTQGNADAGVKSRIYRASASLDGWTPAAGITKTGSSFSNESIYDMRFMGAAVVMSHFRGSSDEFEVVSDLAALSSVATTKTVIPYETAIMRRDCVNALVGYGTQMLTVDGGLTLSALTQPSAGVLSGAKLYDLVRTGSGRWLGIGPGTTGREFVYTDEATPTTWTNAGRLPGVGGVNIGGFNTQMDASPTAVLCVSGANVYRSDNTGIAFSLVATITGSASYVKWLTGSRWLISTFDTIDTSGSGDRIWYTDDDGDTWTESTSSSQIAANAEVNFSFGGGVVLAGAEGPGTTLWKSIDFGATWISVALPASFMTGFSSSTSQPLTTYIDS